MALQMWEILVPTIRNDGKPFKTRYHRVWDEKVRQISNGLTIMPVAKGQWVNRSDGRIYAEHMIPVRIVCTRDQIVDIICMTLAHYQQIEVMAYKVSDEVLTLRRWNKEG